MNFELYNAEELWRYYQGGYTQLIRSGRYFRQVLRPALSARDLLHLDYAISFGISDPKSGVPFAQNTVPTWPGPELHNATFVAVDALLAQSDPYSDDGEIHDDDLDEDDPSDEETPPPTSFDL